MKAHKSISSSRTTIISIIILDLIIMSLFLYFSDLILRDIRSSNNISNIVISSFAIVVPGTLVILIILQFYRLFNEKLKPGFNFKKNIITYFIFTILIVIIPQTFISINLLNATTDNWLSNKVRDSINIGFNLAIEKENRMRADLKALGSSTLFLSLLKETYIKKNITLGELSELNSLISSIEFFDSNKSSILFLGDTNLRLLSISVDKKNSFYPKVTINDYQVLRFQTILSIYNQQIIVVLSHRLSKDFTKNGTLLTETKNILNDFNTPRNDITYGMILYYGIFTIPLFLLAVLGCFIFSDEVIKPIKDIESAIRKVAHGNYSYRILSKKNNEFNILIHSFNNMIKEVEKSRSKLKHTEQISTWQDIATRLAHEIKNPLTPIKLTAQRLLLKENKNPQSIKTKANMEIIIKEVTRMELLLNEFRDFARFPQLTITNSSIKATILESINSYTINYPHINFDTSNIEDILFPIDRNQIIQVISNLTINGIHAIEEKGIIKYSSEVIYKKGQEHCRISITDNGKGIKKDQIPNVFKPYFTTKYEGSGLGLAIVNKIILDHKGKIWIESAINLGTTFYIELPKEVT